MPRAPFRWRLSVAGRGEAADQQAACTPWPPRSSPAYIVVVEDHHEGVLHAALTCGRLRVPGVMTTTLRVNAQELQVSTTVEENARDAPASLWQPGRIVSANNG